MSALRLINERISVLMRIAMELGEGRADGRVEHVHLTWCVQVLRSPKEAFAAAMQSWRERCEKCVCLQGDYVEK